MTAEEDDAHRRDEVDPGHRHLFHVPPASGGPYDETAYLAGNSLGLQPRATAGELLADLAAWERLGVEGHFAAARPWFPYHERLREPAARLVGAHPREVVAMNSLTVNLHLLMVSFYRPDGARDRIVIEDQAFPSDSYAVRSQARLHGLDPDRVVVRLRPRPGEEELRAEDVEAFLAHEGDTVALVMLGAVNFLTGELLDVPAITAAGHRAGAVVGWDLAHATGNVPLELHDWDVDFAAWCTYKYLNAGPGAVAGAFVHERHLGTELPRLEGWWSTAAETRFEMAPVSRPPASADAWQVSNPPILAMTPVRTSLELFDRVGMTELRRRSVALTGYLESRLAAVAAIGADAGTARIITPRDPARRGAQLSLRVGAADAAELTALLRDRCGVVVDSRPPDILRLAPAPLYSSFHDCWRAADALGQVLARRP
jgi:kynureninase